MARGGIRDHLGGGYHRYSTDRYWIVPHFEKMLYDNAQLASVHLAAFEITKDPRWRREAEATFAFVDEQDDFARGGFYSALDAETKGEEGAYYVWTRDEVKAALGRRRRTPTAFCAGLRPQPASRTPRGSITCCASPTPAPSRPRRSGSTPEELEAQLRPLRAAAAGRSRKAAGRRCSTTRS